MKLELKQFQEIAARDIIGELDEARLSVAKGKPQAVILSAPTGSGKTITLAEVIDLILGGGDGIPARPQTTFLWLSDSPELNVQSANKLLGACDFLPYHKMIRIESDVFDDEYLQPGYVYFINTQLLGKDKLLTKESGDRRKFTFWQTIARTIERAPEDFILVIDEAHRGATANDKNRTTIMQKFIVGSESDGLPPVPLVLGMSATPQRFTTLLGNTNRTQRPINISTDDVRSSGLLKDWIVVKHPRTAVAGDLTLLESATKSWKQFTKLWETYCTQEKEKEIMRPILVVQIEDGSGNVLTRTLLDDVVRVIERHSGPLGLNEIVHCLQDQTDIEAGGRIIRKVEASRVQESQDVKVVLFKTALSTGWDCPRAEVMMSFRRAQDQTSIAQLVGRMIRTPLARRIGTNEVLDTVELYLPHYDADALEAVLERLRNPDAQEGVPTRVETAVESYSRNPDLEKVFGNLDKLPTYSVDRVPRMSEVKRALRLSGLLVHEGIDVDADDDAREQLIKKLKVIRDKCASDKPAWDTVIREGGEIEVDVSRVVTGAMKVAGKTSVKVTLVEENIDQLFEESGRMLASGEGLHRTYWKRYHDKAHPNHAKLELFAVLNQPETFPAMERLAKHMFDELWSKHKVNIQRLPVAARKKFQSLIQAAGEAALLTWELPVVIVEKKEGDVWKQHLYCDAKGGFSAKLTGWEKELLEGEMKNPDFVAWLRNLPRREWAICIPYELAGLKSFYPDFVILRKRGKDLLVDFLEPHDDSRTDTWAKAKGLAAYADKHGMELGRLIIARKKDKVWQMADVNEKETRARARRMQSSSDLESLFV
jgi:type III restriction enzyme